MTRAQCVLIVDDNADHRYLYATTLANECARIVTYSSPVHALEFLRTSDPCALVFSDVAMPEMDGLAFAREARRLRPEIPIVLITGHEGVVDHALADGYFVLLKPVDPDVLVRVAREHLGHD